MKKHIATILLALALLVPKASFGQIAILEVIKAGVKKVIKAIDLKIQRQQNKVIWLQNAQKTLENTLSKLRLDEIGDWVGRQKELYKDYYQELAKVKALISYYQQVKDLTAQQLELVESYKRAWALLKSDPHFTAQELDYMQKVYQGILAESVKNLDQIGIVINSFQTTMSDARRLELIGKAADRLEENYRDLNRFNTQNKLLSIERAGSAAEAERMKKLYGID